MEAVTQKEMCCGVVGCDKPRRTYKGRVYSRLCTTHMGRKRRHGGTEAYAKKPGPQLSRKNSAWISTSGYLRTMFYGVESYVHRLVWALTYGPIPNGYDVHHKDENRLNNAIENLEAMPAPEHHRLHRAKSRRGVRRTARTIRCANPKAVSARGAGIGHDYNYRQQAHASPVAERE